MIRKVFTKSGEIKWEARHREGGRGTRNVSRRFDRKVDAEQYEQEQKRLAMDAKHNPFSVNRFQVRTFNEEAELWLAEVKLQPNLKTNVKIPTTARRVDQE